MYYSAKSFIAAATLSVLAFGFTSCDKNNNGDPSGLSESEKAMKAVVEQYVPGVVYPICNDLARETGELYELLSAAAGKGVGSLTQSELDAICAKFLQARQSWEESESFLYGPATIFGIDPHIDTWPLDVEALAVSLSNREQVEFLKGEEGIIYAGAKLGQELLGFHGIEFILFRDGRNRSIDALRGVEAHEAFKNCTVTGEQELIYAAAVAGDLRDNCYRLCASWDPDADPEFIARCEELEVPVHVFNTGKTYGQIMLGASEKGSTYETWQEVISEILVGGCSNISNEVANVKMGNAHTGEDTNYIESPYSKMSFQDFIDNILSIKYSLFGRFGASNPVESSVASMLQNLGYKGVTSLTKAIDDSVAALRACQAKGAFVDIYADSSVQTAMDAINSLDSELNKAAAWVVLQ